MKEPIPPHNGQSRSSFGGQNGQAGHRTGDGNKSKPNKNDYCWNFNKGVKCKFGSKCKFIERCSYCDSGAHGLNTCTKKNKGKNNNNNNNVNRDREEGTPSNSNS